MVNIPWAPQGPSCLEALTWFLGGQNFYCSWFWGLMVGGVWFKVVEVFEQFLFRILELNGWPRSQRLSSKETLDIPHKIHVIGTFIPHIYHTNPRIM